MALYMDPVEGAPPTSAARSFQNVVFFFSVQSERRPQAHELSAQGFGVEHNLDPKLM